MKLSEPRHSSEPWPEGELNSPGPPIEESTRTAEWPVPLEARNMMGLELKWTTDIP